MSPGEAKPAGAGAPGGGSEPEVPEQNPARTAPGVYCLDQAVLKQWAARQCFTCRVCAERLNASNMEAVIRHPLLHDISGETRRDVERALSASRELKRQSEAVKQKHLAWAIRRVASDPATFERLQREGVIVRVAGKG